MVPQFALSYQTMAPESPPQARITPPTTAESGDLDRPGRLVRLPSDGLPLMWWRPRDAALPGTGYNRGFAGTTSASRSRRRRNGGTGR